MAKALRSITCPNDQWTAHSEADLAAILALAPDGLLTLAYPGSDSQADRIIQEKRLWEALGRPPFILRPYAENILSRDPRDWARDCNVLVRSYWDAGIEIAGIIPWNEPNIEGLQGDDWGGLVAWENVFADEYGLLAPDILLHRPALAPMRNYRLGYEVRAARGSPKFSVEDLHIYSSEQLADIPFLHNLFPTHPIAITEWNFATWQ